MPVRPAFARLLCCLITLPASLAPAQSDVDERESEMFGSQQEPSETEASREAEMFAGPDEGSGKVGDREQMLFGDDEGAGAAFDMGTLDARLASADDPLAIGGRLYLRLNYTLLEKGVPENFALNNPNLLDLFLDARPNDRVRAYAKGRLQHDFTLEDGSVDFMGRVRKQTRAMLDQLWMKFDVNRTLFVTLGRQSIRWGEGRFWNPTDFLNQQARDPLAVFDERLGVSLIKLHLPIEALGWNFYGVANIEQARKPREIGGALRAELLFGTTEVAVTAATRRKDPLRLGLGVSSGIWLLDLRCELALLRNDHRNYWRGDFDLQTLELPRLRDRSDDFIPQAVGGFELGIRYSDEDSVFLGGEYFYNGRGYQSAKLYPWLIFKGDFQPLYLGRHYGAVYAYLPGPGDWDDTSFIVSTLGNFSDGSYTTRFDYRVRLLTYLDVSAFASYHYGHKGEFRLGIELPPTPGVPELSNGLSVVPPTLDVGIWLAVGL